jgi:hypothetical protein
MRTAPVPDPTPPSALTTNPDRQNFHLLIKPRPDFFGNAANEWINHFGGIAP